MITLACPRCHTSLDDVDAMTKSCVIDGLTFHQIDGIWQMLMPEREEYFARSIRDYEIVRRFEGRGSTDAPYRETREEVKQNLSEGVKTVEMETASLYALGQVRGMDVASVVVAGDSFAELRWQAPADVPPIEPSLEVVYAAAIDMLGQA